MASIYEEILNPSLDDLIESIESYFLEMCIYFNRQICMLCTQVARNRVEKCAIVIQIVKPTVITALC